MHLCTHVRVYLHLCIFHEAALSQSLLLYVIHDVIIFSVYIYVYLYRELTLDYL